MRKKLFFIIIPILLLICGVVLYFVLAPKPAEPDPTPAPTAAPTPTPEPTPDPALVALDELRAEQEEELYLLTLVNKWNPIEEDYEPELYYLGDDKYVDVVCAEALRQMMADCTEAGNDPYICSAYRSGFDQKMLFLNKYYRVVLDGIPEEEAEDEAAKSVAPAGTSEHQLGLAVDIISYSYIELDEGQEKTSTQQWLMENCWRYGFILRYPVGSSDITGIIYEPWHYRYVGLTAAEAIHERGITLEEYLHLLYP